MTGTHPGERTRLRNSLQAGDPDQVSALVRATGFFSEAEQLIARELVEETLARGAAAGYLFWLLEQDGRVIAYTCYGPIPGTRSSWDLYWIVVDPAMQGLGLGRQLLAATEQRVVALGGTALYIETSSQARYAPTRAFYSRCGYELIGTFEDFYAPGDAKCTYCRALASGAGGPLR